MWNGRIRVCRRSISFRLFSCFGEAGVVGAKARHHPFFCASASLLRVSYGAASVGQYPQHNRLSRPPKLGYPSRWLSKSKTAGRGGCAARIRGNRNGSRKRKMDLGNGLGHLTYSTLVHPADNWEQLYNSLVTYLPKVKARIAGNKAFGVCIRLSASSAETLANSPAE